MSKNKEFKRELEGYQEKISMLQRELRAKEIPVVIVVEGWGTSGKGQLINNFILPLDPRGFMVYATKDESEEERRYPFLRRFVTKMPEKGRIAIFDRSWYRRVLNDHIDKKVEKSRFNNDISEINSFEKLLTDDGNLLIKIFLHISKDEQIKRINNLLSKNETKWRVSSDDIKHNKQYSKYSELSERIISATGKWSVIDANNLAFATLDIFKVLISEMEKQLLSDIKPSGRPEISEKAATNYLKNVDLSLDLGKKAYNDKLSDYQSRLERLHNILYLNKVPLIIVFEGWDAAGKGGAIKRLTTALDPRGYQVISTPAPTPIEKSHHYLWRFWNNIPRTGHISIFDRSWYGRVMVEPVEGFCSQNEYDRAFSEINNMEKHIYSGGGIILKFFIHISKEEQLLRFNDRKENPQKSWKLTDEDFRNRDKWDIYVSAIEKMLEKTSTAYAPWHIISGNSKKYARIEILKIITERLEKEFFDK